MEIIPAASITPAYHICFDWKAVYLGVDTVARFLCMALFKYGKSGQGVQALPIDVQLKCALEYQPPFKNTTYSFKSSPLLNL